MDRGTIILWIGLRVIHNVKMYQICEAKKGLSILAYFVLFFGYNLMTIKFYFFIKSLQTLAYTKKNFF